MAALSARAFSTFGQTTQRMVPMGSRQGHRESPAAHRSMSGGFNRAFSGDATIGKEKAPKAETKSNKIAFIGAGKMAEAMISGMLSKGVQTPETLVVHDVWEKSCKRIQERFPGVKRAKTLPELTKNADIVVLAVKPQESHKMLAELSAAVHSEEGKMSEKAVLVSIMTGKPVHWLYEHTQVPRIVRAMPNTPVSIQEGCVVWFPTDEVEVPQLKAVASMFSAIGDHVMVQDERYLDMSTAISGSGPYYLFLTMETMVDAGVHMGLPREMSERLVKQTLLGSCMYALNSNQSISRLRNDIISPGGTTASAQYTLERGGFRATVYDAIWSAYRRSLELGGENSNVGPGRSSTAVLRTFQVPDGDDAEENEEGSPGQPDPKHISKAHDGGGN
eukprot:CAMPEP_0173416306 /NCGR_PEP_ID=MMETSP1356-20130122/85320_1 /TAXON_ID=77927 ORGANISM="Hemiselmis virescens, Strain PCC157" /NCGR_SAMPLE_ID=MMETSP1356 /ASSEMBLY_ACC=CAM_ASM_000847 /LENGTH=389 /DNA_ID=CAMNT_0014378613 /DNA_START=70 /DNA_END=1239 /DNA_ORIENTATION=+